MEKKKKYNNQAMIHKHNNIRIKVNNIRINVIILKLSAMYFIMNL